MANDLLNAMHISASGMSAQRTRMDIIAENIANAESTHTPEGGPYRRRQVVFRATPQGAAAGTAGGAGFGAVFTGAAFAAPGQGLQGVAATRIAEDPRPFREIYDPSHPDADANGIVRLPNVNVIEEMVDMQSAARSFEANVSTMEASRRMFLKTLELLK